MGLSSQSFDRAALLTQPAKKLIPPEASTYRVVETRRDLFREAAGEKVDGDEAIDDAEQTEAKRVLLLFLKNEMNSNNLRTDRQQVTSSSPNQQQQRRLKKFACGLHNCKAI